MRVPWWILKGAEDDAPESDPVPVVVETPSTQNLTADELEKLTARVADRTKRTTSKAIAKEFGFEAVDQFKEWVKARQQAEQDALDENEKARQDAEKARRDYESQLADLVSDRLDIAIERQVLAAKVSDPKKLSRVSALIRLDLSDDILDTEDSWDDAIAEALASVQADTPELFGGTTGYGSGDGGARGKSTDEPDTEAEAVKKLQSEFANRGLIQYPG